MHDYTVTFAQSARKDLERLSASIVSRIFPQIEALELNPRSPRCRKITGSENLWRIRVGDYRVVYQVLDAEHMVDIIAVRHRSQAYKLK